MKKIFWAQEAEETYLDVVDFLLHTWGMEIVEKFQTLVDLRLDDLKSAPLLGKELALLPFRQLVIHKNISLYYRVYPKHIILLAVWDNRQNPSRLLELLNKSNSSS